tara:strand:- start:73 stop:519 length:447 start_codon:yes stop_codon:yes gene_type:complete
MPIKSFRGMLADLAKETIHLATNDGSTGYRIKKFQLIGRTPGSMTIESVVKIYKIPQTGTPDGTVDFSDNTLLAAGYYIDNSNAVYPGFETIVFDNEIFNQDIYITHFDASTSEFINYYLELEQVKLSLDENTVATLKDIRNIEAQYV